MLPRKLLTGSINSAPFHPTDITGCLIALRWDLGVLNSSDTAATDGQTVKTWQDQSGNNRHFAQGTDGARPFYRSAGYIEFNNGSDTVLTNGDTWTLGNTVTIVTRQTYKKPANNGDFFGPVGITGGKLPVIFWNRSGNANAGVYLPTDDDLYGANLTADQIYMFSCKRNSVSGDVTAQLDDETPTTVTIANSWNTNKIDRVGNYATPVYSPQNRVYSLVAYNTILSDGNLEKVKAWCEG